MRGSMKGGTSKNSEKPADQSFTTNNGRSVSVKETGG